MKMLQIWKDPKTMEWCQHYGNVNFHFNISCAQKYNREMNVENIISGEDTFIFVTADHLHFLNIRVLTDIGDQTEKFKGLYWHL